MKIKKLILSSLVGAIYSIVLIFINYSLLKNSFLKFICATIMNLITFENKSINSFAKNIIAFYMVTFALGGITLYTNEHLSNLYIVLALTLILIPSIIKEYKTKYKFESYYGKILLNENGTNKEIKCFIDTGNNLKSCYEEPVIVLSSQYRIKQRVDIKKARRISYKTINEKEVCVDGIKIEKIVLEYRKEQYENEAVLINSNVRFENYDAIIGLDFFESARKINKKEKENENGYFAFNKSQG